MLSLLGKLADLHGDLKLMSRPISGTEGMDRLQTASMTSQIPLSRMGDKSESLSDWNSARTDPGGDIAHAAAFLFSPAASWVTGQVLVSLLRVILANPQAVDGGEHHMRTSALPYPDSMLDPQSVVEATKSKPKPTTKSKL